MTHVKEQHVNIIEGELETLRNDYFKAEHYKEYANLNELFSKTLQSASKARQNIDVQAAEETLAGVLQIAEIFYKSKGVTPIRVKSVYPTGGEMVFYK
jgi:nickel-type superoxide dismutase